MDTLKRMQRFTLVEDRILKFLQERAGYPCTINELYDKALNEKDIHLKIDQEDVENYIRVYIRYLRQKGVSIETLRGRASYALTGDV